ncbi:ABC transporter permease [Streptomyces sp. V3I8]|uniref:ABC transporter permease n=1 Tax=Streptomyces sp. V3I8 TaxID=3042279 RepID=UPI0027D85B2F|nr:hypothetical protein [Streptomyces sp. V3I8]
MLGLAFVLRAVEDTGDGTLSWFSPIGWVRKARPFAGERWWPLLVAVAAAVALVAVADALSDRRDIGAGPVTPRSGPRTAAPGLGRPLGLALRLQRGGLVGWSAGVFLTGAAYGWLADDIEDLVGDNEAVRDAIAPYGDVGRTDSYLARSMLTPALIASGYAVQSVLRLRGEETSLLAEPVLATLLPRHRWAAGHLIVAPGGSVLVLAAGGPGAGLAYGITGHDLGQVPRLLGAALVYAPALWPLVGLTTALFGLVPRAVAAAWAAVAFCLVIGVLSELLDVPVRVTGLSPFQHTPLLPAEDLAVAPLLALSAIAVALTVLGLIDFHRQDLGGTATI